MAAPGARPAQMPMATAPRARPGLGGAGVVGADLGVTAEASSSITGGMSAGGTIQAASIDFTSGVNTLTLNGGTLSGGIVDGDTDMTTTLTFGQTSAQTLPNGISGVGSVVDSGTGVLTLTATETYTGSTTIDAGSTIQLGDGTTDGAPAGTSGIVDGGTLVDDDLAGLTIGQVISGTGSLVKKGVNGTLILNGANTYSGGTTLTAGTLEATTSTATDGTMSSSVGTGTVALDGGALQLDGITLANAVTLDANGSTVTLAYGNATGIYGGTLSGKIGTAAGTAAPGRLTVGGYGTLVLTGTDTVAGGLIIQGGSTVRVGAYGTSGMLTGNVSDSGTLAFARQDGSTYTGNLSGTGELHQIAGITVLTGTNTLTGQTTIEGGTLQAGSLRAFSDASVVGFEGTGKLDLAGLDQTVAGLQNGSTGSIVTNSGAASATLTIASSGYGNPFSGILQDGAGTLALDVEGSLTLLAASTSTGGTRIAVGGRLGLDSTGSVTGAIVDDGTLVLSGNSQGKTVTVSNAISGIGGILVTPSSYQAVAAVILSDANTYTGATQVTGGTLQGGVADAFGTDSAVSIGRSFGTQASILDLGGYDQHIGSLADGSSLYGSQSHSGAVTNNGTAAATLTVGGNNASTEFDGSVQDGGETGKLALDKVGTGTLTLGGQTGYRGNTVISAGTLALSTSAEQAFTGTVTFAAPGATLALAVPSAATNTQEIELAPALQSDAAATASTPLASTTLDAFGPGDALDLRNLDFASGATATLNAAGTLLQVVSNGVEQDFAVSNPGASAFAVTDDKFASTSGDAGVDGALVTAYALPTIAIATANTATTDMNPVSPFAGDTITDPNGGADTLAIALSGGGGTLSGAGLVANTDGTYTLTGSASTVTSELQALRFTPTGAGAAGSTNTTRFTLTDTSSVAAAATATDSTTTVTDMVAVVAPSPTPTPTPDAHPDPDPDARARPEPGAHARADSRAVSRSGSGFTGCGVDRPSRHLRKGHFHARRLRLQRGWRGGCRDLGGSERRKRAGPRRRDGERRRKLDLRGQDRGQPAELHHGHRDRRRGRTDVERRPGLLAHGRAPAGRLRGAPDDLHGRRQHRNIGVAVPGRRFAVGRRAEAGSDLYIGLLRHV